MAEPKKQFTPEFRAEAARLTQTPFHNGQNSLAFG